MERREFTSAEIKAAALMALGEQTTGIAFQCKLDLEYLRKLKKDPDFIGFVEEAKERIKNQVFTEVSDLIASDVSDFRRDFRVASKRFQDTAAILMDKCQQAAENLLVDDITAKNLPSILKATTEALKTALDIRKASLGLDELMAYTDEFQKIAESRSSEFGTGEPDLTTTEED